MKYYSRTNPQSTSLTSKGQVTIPIEVRTHLGLQPRDRVRFVVEDDGVRIERELSLEDVFASVPALDPPLTNEQTDKIIEDEVAAEYAHKHLGHK